jgi:hypothetical protein
MCATRRHGGGDGEDRDRGQGLFSGRSRLGRAGFPQPPEAALAEDVIEGLRERARIGAMECDPSGSQRERALVGWLRTSAREGQIIQRTVRVTVVVFVGAPALVPVIVSVRVARCALPAAVIVSAELVPVTDEGLNVPVTPDGSPLTESATAPEKPAVRVMVTVYVPVFPRRTVSDAGAAERENDPGAVTTSETLVVCVSPPPVPVTVSE